MNLRIHVMDNEGEPSEVVVFHYCENRRGCGYYGNTTSLPTGLVEEVKILDRINWEDFLAKKFKTLTCGCGLKYTPDEIVFKYFTDILMGDERI